MRDVVMAIGAYTLARLFAVREEVVARRPAFEGTGIHAPAAGRA